MPKPKVIIFDVNETLLDLGPLKHTVGTVLGGREELLPLWFSTMLHYSLVETVSGHYHGFDEIGTAALMMVAESQEIEVSENDARAAIVSPMQNLPPHDDVISALKSLSKCGYRVVCLTNSSSSVAEAQLKNAGIAGLFEKCFSVETVRKFKPHPDTYRMVLDDLGVGPKDGMMVAAHAWDLVGAKNVGLQTALVTRAGVGIYPIGEEPDYVVDDLSVLVNVLK